MGLERIKKRKNKENINNVVLQPQVPGGGDGDERLEEGQQILLKELWEILKEHKLRYTRSP